MPISVNERLTFAAGLLAFAELDINDKYKVLEQKCSLTAESKIVQASLSPEDRSLLE